MKLSELGQKSRKRLLLLSIGMFFLFSLLLIQFYKIQIIEGEKWVRKARNQHELTVVEPCRRGTFYSNTDIKEGHLEPAVPFVIDVPRFHVYIDTTTLSEQEKKEICVHLVEDTKQGADFLDKQLHIASKARKLAMWLSAEEKSAIEKWWFPFAKQHKIPRNALFFLQEFKRSYPCGSMLGQILHTVREERDPKTRAHIPTGGLELALDAYLRGKEGKRTLLRSPKKELDAGEVIVAPEDGADVFLTINHYLQAVTEEEIAKAVEKAHAKGGWAIMMEPYTGEVLAWAQYPSFAPARYREFFSSADLESRTKCKGITDPFEPGSTFKPFTILLCLKANEELKRRGERPLFSPLEKVATSNGYFPGRSKPIRDTKCHHYLNMYMALQKSSNIYMARMIQRVIERLGDDWYRNCLENDFGMGLRTGIELSSESPGVLPRPGRTHANGALEWSKPTPYSLAMGYNILTNSLQMVRAYAMIANGGYRIQPSLVKKIVKTHRDGTKQVLVDKEKERKEQIQEKLWSEESRQELIRGMRYVTKPGGSASKADIFGYTEVGKTATSEKIVKGNYSSKDHISTFIGWSPVLHPRFVLMVVIDEPEAKFIPGIGKNQMGGNCAAPAFAAIGKRTLEYLGETPDDPFGFPVGDPRRDVEKAIWIKEAKALTELYESWNH